MKIHFFGGGGGWGVGSGVRLGGQGGCERRSEAFVKIKKKKYIYIYFFFGGGGVGGVGFGGQGGCERRSEVFVKIQKKMGGGVGDGVRWSEQGLGWGRGGSKVCGRW